MPRKPVRLASPSINLAERIDALSIKRQEIIRPILEHPREYVLLSVRAMALRLRTDPATVVRIVRGLGFAHYKEFRRHLHDLSIAFATTLETMQEHRQDATLPSYVRDSIMQDLKNLQGLKNSVDVGRFSPLAKRIYAARRIVILGGDLAAVLAEYLGYQLSVLGLPVLVTTSPGRVLHAVRGVGKRDLVVSISFRRALRQTVEGTQEARKRGAYCVGIADTYLSPLARDCHEIFLATIESTSFGASYTAPVALVNAMLAACGQHRRSRTLAIVRELSEEERKGSRWHNP